MSKAPRGASRIPVYMQIEEALRGAIARGAYAPGDRLPSEAELARRFATTRSTVIHALQKLVYERLIERRQGRGTFVAAPNDDHAAFDANRFGYFERYIVNQGLSLAYKLVDFAPGEHDARAGAALCLSGHEALYRLRRIRIVQGKPLALEVRYMPALTAVRIEEKLLEVKALQDIFAEDLGITIASCPTIVRVGLAGKREAKYLQIARGRPVFVNEHTFCGVSGVNELWGETIYTEDFRLCYSRNLLPESPLGMEPEMRLQHAP